MAANAHSDKIEKVDGRLTCLVNFGVHMLNKVNYNDKQYASYQQGREINLTTQLMWANTFAAHAPNVRPLTVLDLGSGTGRFTPLLARTFSGPVYGVEPSQKMRAIAENSAHHPNVTYMQGSAENIPLPEASCDLVLMFLSFHHVQDRQTAALEIARILRPGGRVFIRSTFSDRMPDLDWHHYFPRAREIEMKMFPTSQEVIQLFSNVGLHLVTLEEVEEQFAPNLAEHAARLRMKAISTFEYLSEQEITEGFKQLDAAVTAKIAPHAITGSSDLLVLG